MKRWAIAIALLAAFRAAVALAALAAHGDQLPGLPRYRFVALPGDATGYYAAAREFMAAWGRLPVAVFGLVVLAALAGAVLLVREWRRAPHRRPWLVVAGCAGASALATLAVTQMNAAGAAVFGWPLVWALPMLPYRATGAPLDPEIAFGFGLALSLAANAVTIAPSACSRRRCSRSGPSSRGSSGGAAPGRTARGRRTRACTSTPSPSRRRSSPSGSRSCCVRARSPYSSRSPVRRSDSRPS
jgi:hypothetical protein